MTETKEKTLYQDISALMGKFEDDPGYTDLLDRLGKFPLIRGDIHSHQYWFLDSGFALFAGYFGVENRLVFVGATVTARAITTAEGLMRPFDGPLPFELKAEDSRPKVQEKMGKVPVKLLDPDEQSKDVDTYVMQRLEYQCTFEDGERLTGFLVTLNGQEVNALMDKLAKS